MKTKFFALCLSLSRQIPYIKIVYHSTPLSCFCVDMLTVHVNIFHMAPCHQSHVVPNTKVGHFTQAVSSVLESQISKCPFIYLLLVCKLLWSLKYERNSQYLMGSWLYGVNCPRIWVELGLLDVHMLRIDHGLHTTQTYLRTTKVCR